MHFLCFILVVMFMVTESRQLNEQEHCAILSEGLFSGILSESESMEIHSPPHHPKKIKKKLVEIENYMVLNLDSQG